VALAHQAVTRNVAVTAIQEYQLTTAIPRSSFRAYDIRGIADTELTPDSVYTIARAIATFFRQNTVTEVVIARDDRLSSPVLYPALKAGLLDTGLDVIELGRVPTPMLYFATHVSATSSGIMLTASHNAAQYNGLKIVFRQHPLTPEQIQQIYDLAVANDFVAGQGNASELAITERYLEHVARNVNVNKPLKVVVDCGNAITSEIAPQLLQRLGCEVVPLHCVSDGRFPNHHPDPTIVENLQDLIGAVHEHQTDIGLALDGDGDRLGVVTETGEIIWPDRQLMLFARDILPKHLGATVIYDVKCSRHLATVIEEQQGKPLMWKTGHSLIENKMVETDAVLAGEMSGHLFFRDRWFGCDDGLYTAARLLEVLSRFAGGASELFAQLPNSFNTPELKLEVCDEDKFRLMDDITQQAEFVDATVTTIDGLRVEYPDGWGLIRPSNTTPCLVLRFEADDETALKHIQAAFREQLLKVDDSLSLPF